MAMSVLFIIFCLLLGGFAAVAMKKPALLPSIEGMPYIVFPGNVGDLHALAAVYGRMCRQYPLPHHSLTLSNP